MTLGKNSMKSSLKQANNKKNNQKSTKLKDSKTSFSPLLKPLRVIGGKHKGLKLYAPKVARPSKSILKESCFNILSNAIADKIFIEAFAGSGAMGIESLSRGAKKAVFFEQDKEALEVLAKNLALLSRHKAGQNNPQNTFQSNYQIISGDSLQNLPPFLAKLKESSILYIDPPFFIRQNYADIYEKCANIIAHINSQALQLVILEHSSLYEFSERLGDFTKTKYRKFGKSALTFFTHILHNNT